ncbi:MAG: hypothetical protein KGH71_03165 [Candidatus Micrarchaeota archaeon]|nr:hypothetical protein [Candidatus Micrarchaeota archaeon]
MAVSKSERSRKNLMSGIIGVVISAFALLALYTFIVTFQYQSYVSGHSSVLILNPPIKFYVGTQQVPSVRTTAVLVNQTFCPESAQAAMQAGMLDRFPYFVRLNASQDFSYSMTYNPSNFTFVDAYVVPPFKIISFGNHIMNVSHCVGYPGAIENFTVNVEAPNASYIGSIYLLLYGKKN